MTREPSMRPQFCELNKDASYYGCPRCGLLLGAFWQMPLIKAEADPLPGDHCPRCGEWLKLDVSHLEDHEEQRYIDHQRTIVPRRPRPPVHRRNPLRDSS